MKDNYYENIKELLVKNEINKTIKDYSKNKSDLDTYFNVGKEIIEAQGGEERAKYGNGLIKEFSKRLTNELGKGYSITNLKNMRSFYLFVQKGQSVPDQLSWSHYQVLLSIKDFNKIKYYIDICIKQNLGYRELGKRIKSEEYERLPEETKNKLISNEDINLIDSVKNPIIIKSNNTSIENIKEFTLRNLILEDIPSFMKELGSGFSFIDKEYKIKLEDKYNYIDLLLFNYEYNCFVVIELKVTELKKEHIGQIEVYMNYIDKNVKNINQNDTVGIIICKKNNKYIIEYCSDKRIISREYSVI